MTQKELAAALNLNQSQVSRYTRRGMPADEAGAKAWLCTHVAMTLHAPLWRRQVRAKPTQALPAAPPPPDPVAAAEVLNLLLRDHLADKAVHAAIVPRLQAAMRAVPPHRRNEVLLFLGCWEALLGCTPTLREDEDFDQYIDDDRPWYSIAAGEVAA